MQCLHINFALAQDNLHFDGTINVHHIIEIFSNEVGPEEIKKKVTNPLKDLKIAPYYGCQIVRPRKDGENLENPQFFEEIIAAMGAEPVDFAERLRCCGASLIMTSRHAALGLVRVLLQNAVNSGADIIATACPLCQVNLECYQTQVNEEFGTNFSMPVLYFTQLLGLALGIPRKRLGIGKELISAGPIFSKIMGKGG
jgi:heterodisulfide reductase subunit B